MGQKKEFKNHNSQTFSKFGDGDKHQLKNPSSVNLKKV